MMVDKQAYYATFQEIIDEYHTILKEVGSVPSKWNGYLKGYIDVGLLLEITSADELDKIIQESNYKIFEMSVEERKKKYKNKKKITENDLDIPTFIREGINLEL